jgi:acyl-CoA dehydrogenase
MRAGEPGLTNPEFALRMKTLSRATRVQSIFDGNARDRGNMEVLAKYGSKEPQESAVCWG